MTSRYTKELLEPIIARSTSWAQVCREVGIKPYTGSQVHLTKQAKKLGVDYSHFLGKRSNIGKESNHRRPLETLLVDDETVYISSHRLKNKLIHEGVKSNKCESCGLNRWVGEPLPLELDHRDRNHLNNLLSNLQILCPNCHAVKTRKDRARVV